MDKETNTLILDSTKIRNTLHWNDQLSFDMAIKMTCDWYASFFNGSCISEKQLKYFIEKN